MSKQEQQDLNIMLKIGGFAGVSKISDILTRYATSIVLTRILGVELFGIFVLGRTIVMVTGLLSKLGMGYGVVRQIAFYTAKNDDNKIQQTIRLAILVSCFISLTATILLLWLGDYFSTVLFKKPMPVLPLKILVFTIPIITILHILMDVLRGFKKINKRIVVEFYFLPLSNLLMIFIFFLLGYRLEGAIVSFILSNIISLMILIIINRKKIRITGPPPFLKKKVVLEFFKFSFPLAFVDIIGVLKNRIEVLFLGLLSTASNVGIFFIAFRLANLTSIPWQAFNMIFAPMVSGYYARNEIKKIEYNYKNITKLMVLFSMYFLGFLLIFSSELLSIFGSEFIKGTAVVILICFGQMVKTWVGHAGPMLAMIGKPSLNLLITVITLILMAMLNLLLIPRLGITGAAVAHVTGMTVSSLLELFFIHRLLHIHPFRKDFLKPVFAVLLSGAVIYLFKTLLPKTILVTVFLATAFTALYSVLLYLQKLTNEEMEMLYTIRQTTLTRRIKKSEIPKNVGKKN
ncbi:MAG: oligosaccharide flippase family protein [Candidatus Aminicenantes bacterium]|nr:MAG: oligosaccharide flippase family protein [Candidatus Aminicenantes bacterium]